MATILVIDDEKSILESLEMFLSEKGHRVATAPTAEKGLALFAEEAPQIVILDIRLPDLGGLEVLSRMEAGPHRAKVIMVTAYQDMETTIEAMKRGAFDYIHKPLDVDEIERAVSRAMRIARVASESSTADAGPLLGGEEDPWAIIGKSEKMGAIYKTIGLVCRNNATVLLQGETGTGKELIARVIHNNGLYNQEPFVVLDCSAVVENLLESELFGHDKGAFTGADRESPGKIELAGKGTLLLDEVAELPIGLQGKLLGFLQRREYMRVGGRQPLLSKCRIIAACNCDLAQRVRQGGFKEDLYFRLRVVTMQVPPLRERLSDIPLLVHHFIHKKSRELGTEVVKLQKGVMERLMAHPWKGNVRELENVIVEALVCCRGDVILAEDIQGILASDGQSPPACSGGASLAAMEKSHIQKILADQEWNRTQAARILGISLPTLRSKIKKYGLRQG